MQARGAEGVQGVLRQVAAGERVRVLEQRGRRLLRARPVGADHPGRTPLDPARHVLAGRGPARAHHPARRVRDRGRRRVERQAGQRHALVPHRAQHQLRLDVLVHAGPDDPAAAVRGGALEAHPGDPAVRAAEHLHRAQVEPQRDAAPRATARAPVPFRPAAQHVQVAPGHRRQGGGRVRAAGVRGVEGQLGGVHADGHAGERAELPQLLGGELALRGPAPGHHRHRPHPAVRERAQGRLRHVGRRQLRLAPGQHPRHVHGHVARPDDDRRAHPRQVEGLARGIGVPAVPGHEGGGGMDTGQILAGDPQHPVAGGAHAVHHRVVQLQQARGGQLRPADLDVAEEADPLVLQDRAQAALQRLDLLVVGGHSVPHEPVRSRQPVQYVDAYAGHLALLYQGLGGIDPTGARTDDGDTEHGGTPPAGTPSMAPGRAAVSPSHAYG